MRIAFAGLAGGAVATVLGLLLAVTAQAATPVLTLQATEAEVGQSTHAIANLSEAPDASGEIFFTVFGPGDDSCAGTGTAVAPAPVSGEGEYASGEFTPTAAGTYSWSAEYSGDGVNEPADAACASFSVAKASPSLSGEATAGVPAGQTITDTATLSGGYEAAGEIVFRAFGPSDEACSEAPVYEAAVAVDGPGPYSPAGFAPAPGLYRWTATYSGDANNEGTALACGADNQASAVGIVVVKLTASATSGVVGTSVVATARLARGATPSGEITFNAYPPSDATCSGTPAASSTVEVAGNGSYSSAPLVPSQVGVYRWQIAYTGDVNHAAASVGCGVATSTVSPAAPSILGWVSKKKVLVGKPIQAVAGLNGAYLPGGTITFRIYAPGIANCAKALLATTVAVSGAGPFRSPLYAPDMPGTYNFVAHYSGDAANHAASEPCGSPLQVLTVLKRSPKVMPRAVLEADGRISIQARLAGSFSPSGRISFRLYRPGDSRCTHKPAFSGSTTVRKNGRYSLGEYLTTRRGLYRLVVGYSGDSRNRRYATACRRAQRIRVS
jgi:hypothetical protein